MPDDSPEPPDTPTIRSTVRTLAPPLQCTIPEGDSAAGAGPPVGADRYELLEEIARGGMGVVYKARDRVLGREVGVKTLRGAAAEGSVAAARFRSEAHITGQLQHPNIPPVHDLGTLSDGRPFLAMKLIKGDTLDALLKARPSPAHDRGRFVAVFEQIAHGVAYAHARRVVHRDLKPLNVMVGAFGEVQVMDWGLAKALTAAAATPDGATAADPESDVRPPRDGGDETRPGSVFGTPAYMSREQAIGAVDRIDERSDVFSLGGVLCAILTGAPPYVAGDAESIRRLAAAADLGDCFARLGGCGAEPELVALCRRCLAAERADRPPDAGAVARAVADLRAEAERRAREAELDRVRADGERAKAELRAAEQRKRRRVQLALVVVLGLFAATGGALAWRYEKNASERATREVRNADALLALVARCESDLRKDDADGAVAALAEIDRRSSDGGADALRDRIDRCRADLAMLTELSRVERNLWTSASQIRTERSRVTALWSAAFARFGIVPGATPPADAARAVNGSLIRERLLASLDLWYATAPPPELLALLAAADPDPYRDAARGAIEAGDAARLGALGGRPEALAQPGRFAVVLGLTPSIPPARRRAILEAAVTHRPDDTFALLALTTTYPGNTPEGAGERIALYRAILAVRPRWAMAWADLGGAFSDKGDFAAAEAACRTALRLDPADTGAHNNLGLALRARGDLPGAVAAYREGTRLAPGNPTVHANLGLALQEQGDLVGAEAACREAVRLDPTHSVGHNNLGVVLDATGRHAGAAAAFREAARLDPQNATIHFNLGGTLRKLKDLVGAEAACREAVRLDPLHVAARTELGFVLRDTGKPTEAVVQHREASRLDPVYPHPRVGLGDAYRDLRDFPRAIAAYREAIRLDPTFSKAYSGLGTALTEVGQLNEAVKVCREAARLDPTSAVVRFNLGTALQRVRDWSGSITAFDEAIRLDPGYAAAYANLARSYGAGGNPRAAVAASRAAVRLDPVDKIAANNLGFGLLQLGELDEAATWFGAALRIDPTYDRARDNLRAVENLLAERRASRVAPPPREVKR